MALDKAHTTTTKQVPTSGAGSMPDPLETRPCPRVAMPNLIVLGETVLQYTFGIRRKNCVSRVLPFKVTEGHRG